MQHGIIEEGTEVLIETNFTQPGFRFSFPQKKGSWLISPSRIAVESADALADCGSFVAKVLAALPETPLLAIGNNLNFTAPAAELSELAVEVREFPQRKVPNEGETIQQRTFHVGVRRDEHRVANLQLAVTSEQLELSCNCHTKLENRNDANRAAVATAEEFLNDLKYLKSLALHFFGTRFSDDHHGV